MKKSFAKSILGCVILLFGMSIWGVSMVSSKNKYTQQTFAKIANEFETALFDYQPELGLFWGKSDVALDRFMDSSQEGYQKWRQQEDQFLAALSAIDANELQESSQLVTYELLKETLEANQASRICREDLWDVNPASGWHSQLAMIAQKQPVGTPYYRQQALARWQRFDKVVDDQITNLKLGVQQGYTAPKPAVQRVLMQLSIILNNPIEDSPYFSFAKRDTDPQFRRQIKDLVTLVIHPALKKYTDYLQQTYLPIARDEIGVFAIPSGAACYQAKIRQETTLSLTPQEIHEQGLKTMAGLIDEVGDIGYKKYNTRDMTVIFQRAKKDSQHAFTSEQAILDYNFAALQRVQALIPAWFNQIPKSEGTIRPYPEYRAKTGASGEYYPPNDDGTEPGIFYINTFDPKNRDRIDQEATLFHELIPGHHFQIALHYENHALPTVTRYLFNSGFGEGWALYVERLADEMGLYSDDISRLGMLSNEALRSARLVVDTGIHAFQWKREQAVTYLKQHTALSDNIIEGEVDRYIMMPGQATAYMLGKNTIVELRTKAKHQLGSHFDIREFHDQVLKNGTITLPMLQNQMNAWLQEKKISH